MKTTNKPTAYILLKAGTNSEWDNCDFAIVHITEDWKKEQEKRLEAVKPLIGDYHFQAMNFYDTAVDFCRTDENDLPDVDELLAGKKWVFVELDKKEQENLKEPESRLNCYRLAIRANGTAYYTAYGKHTGDEFWTEEFSLTQFTE